MTFAELNVLQDAAQRFLPNVKTAMFAYLSTTKLCFKLYHTIFWGAKAPKWWEKLRRALTYSQWSCLSVHVWSVNKIVFSYSFQLMEASDKFSNAIFSFVSSENFISIFYAISFATRVDEITQCHQVLGTVQLADRSTNRLFNWPILHAFNFSSAHCS